MAAEETLSQGNRLRLVIVLSVFAGTQCTAVLHLCMLTLDFVLCLSADSHGFTIRMKA